MSIIKVISNVKFYNSYYKRNYIIYIGKIINFKYLIAKFEVPYTLLS